jgi:hypothetical protein
VSALKALGSLGDVSDCVMLEDDGGVGQVRIDVNLINSVFGGSNFVEDFLRQQKKPTKLRKPLAPIDDNRLLALKESLVNLQAKMRVEKKQKTAGEKEKVEDQPQPGTQMFAQTQYVLPDFISNEPRYAYQPQAVGQRAEKPAFKTPKKLEPAVATSTPKPTGSTAFLQSPLVMKASLATSTPKAMEKTTPLLKSPLVDAFRRVEERQTPKKSMKPMKPEKPMLSISGALKYFLADSVECVVGSDDDEGKAVRAEIPVVVEVDSPDTPVMAEGVETREVSHY